jgi:polysaccharide pyruvyl transferase WcaK-like protein
MLRRVLDDQGRLEAVYVPLLKRRTVDKLVARFLGRPIERALANGRPTRRDVAALRLACRLCYGRYLPQVLRCRYAFFQAEGTMTGTEFCEGARLLLLPHVAKMVFGKPVISINQTVYSSNPGFRPILCSAYRSHDLVCVREPASLEFLHQLGLNGAMLVPDTAFLTPMSAEDPRTLLEPAPKDRYFCVSGSALMITGDVSPQGLAELIQSVYRRSGLTPVFLCSTIHDRQFAEFVSGWPGRTFPLHRVAVERTYQQVARVLSGAEFLLSGRYHMSILAAVAQTPFVLLASNSYKNRGLAELLDYPLGVREFSDAGAVLSDVAYVLARRSELSEHLERAVRSVRAIIGGGERMLRARLNDMRTDRRPAPARRRAA